MSAAINPELLLSHFDRISDTSGAIPRLRRFILDLAVRGKLVEQDPNDGPASELRKRMRLVREGEIDKQKPLVVSADEEPFAIPGNWIWTRLGQIGDWGSGSTPSRGNHEFFGGGITWLKSGELNDNQQLTGSEESVTELAVRKGSFRQNQPGDVLIAMYGATIGKVAILADPAVTNQAVCGCTPLSGVFNRYLFNFLLSQRVEFQSASEGGAQPNISKIKIVRFLFPLPPLAEQHRIVAKVDELMALCDRLEVAQAERESRRDRLVMASLHRLNQPNSADGQEALREDARFYLSHIPRLTTRPEHIKQLRQTILNLAVRGQLVAQDPNETANADYFSEIKRLKRELSIEKLKRGKQEVEYSATNKALELPITWHWAYVDDVALVQGGKRLPNGATFSKERTDHIYIRVTDMKDGTISNGNLKFH